MSEWSETKLSALGTIKRGKSKHRPRYAFHLYGGKYPFIQTGDVKVANKYITEFSQTYSEAGLAQSKLWPKGTLCITIAANIAETAILSFDACFPDSVIGFIPDTSKCNIDFIFYLLNHYQKELKELGIGSVQDNLNLDSFEKITFSVPSLKEQQSIAEVLSSLDDKIDLLHRQNKTLKQMAETLFRQWFMVEDKDDWIEMTIEDVADINPETISKKFEFTKIEYLDTGSITKGAIEAFLEVDLSEAPSRAQRRVRDNDIVFSLVRPNQCHYGILNGTKPNTIVSTGFCVIRANKISPFFLYLLLTNQANVEYFHSIAEGSTSTYPSLRPDDIAKFTFNLPPEDLCNNFHVQVSSIWEKIFANQRQIKKLSSLRDMLLPKLMNGSIHVTNN